MFKKVLISFLAISFNFYANAFCATNFTKVPQRMFSSRNIKNVAHNLIIRNNTAILQRKSDVLTPQEILEKRRKEEEEKQKAIEQAQKDGKELPDFNQLHKTNGAVIEDGEYEYMTPNDGCYILENGFVFCSQAGKIIKVIRESTNPEAQDYFFYQKDMRCKIAKYNFMYNFLYNKRLIIFHQYQLAFSQNIYPELVRVVIISRSDLLEPEELDDAILKNSPLAKSGIMHDFNKDLIALYISYKKDIGCLPFDNLKLFDVDEEKTFPLFLEKYALAGEWIKEYHSPKSILVSTKGPVVEFYNKQIVPTFKMKLVEKKGVEKD